MLRYIKHNLVGIDGVEIFPIISLVIFVLVFVTVIVYVMRMKKTDIDNLSSIPFEDDVVNNESINN